STTDRSLIAIVPVREWSMPTLIGVPAGAAGVEAGGPSTLFSGCLRPHGPRRTASAPTTSPTPRIAAPRRRLRREVGFWAGADGGPLGSRADETRDRSSFDVVVRLALPTYSARLQSWVNGASAVATSAGRANRWSRLLASIRARMAAIPSGTS